MTKVFLGGSRRISRLSAEIRIRIDNVLSKGFDVLIGDANGADKAIQGYLVRKQYPNVTVFCAGTVCRNNLGDWRTENVPTDRKTPDFRHYAKKDAQMAERADYGFFLWDGNSKGTLDNIVRLVGQGKPALVYLSPKKEFVTIRDANDLKQITSQDERQVRDILRLHEKTRQRVVARQSRLDLT